MNTCYLLLTTKFIWLVCLQAFTEAYSEELQLNTAFNQFVSAYQDAYNGPNTLQHQLGMKNIFLRDNGELCKIHFMNCIRNGLPQ